MATPSGQPAAGSAAGPPGMGLSGTAYLRLVGLGALIGIPAAVVAAAFLAIVKKAQGLLWTDLPDALGHSSPPWYLLLGLPVIGAAIVLAARRLLPGDGGHSPIDGIGSGVTPLAAAPGVALAAFGTLAFGAVLGPEGPLIALGSAVGVTVTLLVKLDARQTAVMGTAGSFSAVSALFGGPLVAGMLLLEGGVGLGAAVIPVLLPGLVAAAIGYVIFVGIGSFGGLDEAGLKIPDLPAYDGTSVRDLVVALCVGVLAAILMYGIRIIARRLRAQEEARHGPGLLLLAGGLAVGVLALVADALGVDSQDVLFSGQAAIPSLVQETSTSAITVLLIAKGLAYAICLGSGFRGGPVFPGVLLGTAIAMFAVVWFDVSPTLAVAVGAAAGMTAATRLLFSSLLFAALLIGTDGLDAIPAAVLAVAASWIVTAYLRRPEDQAAAAAAAA